MNFTSTALRSRSSLHMTQVYMINCISGGGCLPSSCGGLLALLTQAKEAASGGAALERAEV